jgi:hypothetical protein
MTKVTGTISQLNVTGSITQLNVTGVITQLSVNGSIVELGVTHTPPVYVSSEVGTGATNELRIEFDINIDAFSVPLVSEFSFAFSGGAVTAISVTIPSDYGVNKTVDIILSRSIAEGETGTVTYSGTSIRSEADEEGIAEGFTETVINNIIGSVPVFVSATVEDAAPTKVVLTYDVDLDEASVPATTDFTVTDHTVSSVAVSGATVELTLSTAVIYFDILYVTYTKGANPIRDAVGGLDAEDLSSTLVTNNVVEDGNTVGWYLLSDLATITKDGSNFVSQISDKLGGGNNLLQVVGGYQPLWISPGTILLDGDDNYIGANFAFAQPCYMYIVMRQITWGPSADYYWSGKLSNAFTQARVVSPIIRYNAGSFVNLSTMPVNTWVVQRVLFNGVTSKVIINEDSSGDVNLGTNNMDGFFMGRHSAVAVGNVEFAEVVLRKIADTADFETSLYNVLKRRHGL